MKLFLTTKAAKNYIIKEAGFLTDEILSISRFPNSCFRICYIVTKKQIPDFI